MVGVRVVDISRVAVQPGPYPAPGDRHTVQLSFFDTIHFMFPHLQYLFLFPNTADASFPAIVGSLKSSLTRTMPFFHPFAGKLAYIPSDAIAVIDCSASAISEGITFIEAESDLDIHCIAKSEVHESFGQLVPKVKLEFPIVVLAVQVTRFLNGGMALGFSLHHAVADGKEKLQFIEALASICRSDSIPSASILKK
ncbi:HXXXD-type acyl-transferase family protein [Rhynchospora pubera]|uniref:HXXXD-type acyl-transferase family protein n=1 Tax=Rhynchospora pubera TaxID=906938 RepID=A0AAV8C4W7_9POAL|nr:HXXXD-type acyl-transferase family protein [Rhynchospora pubera]